MRSILLLIILAVFAIGACGGATGTPGPTPLPADVSVAQAAALRDAGAMVIDVREPSEWVAGHIQGATLIPLGQLASRLAEVPTGRSIVVVCHTGNRSAQGRDILRAAGYLTSTSMTGGMAAWAGAGQPIVTGP